MLSLSRVAAACVSLLVLRYAYWHLTTGRRGRAFAAQHGCQPVPRYPARDPVLSLDVLYEIYQAERAHRLLEVGERTFDTAAAGGHTFAYHVAGRRILLTRAPENVKAILATDFGKWRLGATRDEIKALLGAGIFTNDGAAWQHSRELLRPAFVRSQVADLARFEAHVRRLIALIPRDGRTFDLMEPFHRLTMDVATDFLFGESTLTLSTDDGGGSKGLEFAAAFEAITGQDKHQGANMLVLLYRHFVPTDDWKRKCALVSDYAGELVEKALKKRAASPSENAADPDGRYVFLEHLVQELDDPVAIRAELLNVLLAGRDTTAALLTNVWFLLARHAGVHVRLAGEIATHVGEGGAPPTYAQIKAMKYLGAVLNEALRLYPIVPSNSREAAVDTVLPTGGGPDGRAPIFVAKGEWCSYHSWSMHRRTDLFGADAAEFRPERWLDGEGDGTKGIRPGWDYLPFNGGPRICIGQQFALLEASYVIIRLMQEFPEVESRDAEPWTESTGITTRSLNGCKVSLRPRR